MNRYELVRGNPFDLAGMTYELFETELGQVLLKVTTVDIRMPASDREKGLWHAIIASEKTRGA